MGPLITAVYKVDGLKGDYFLAQDKAQEAGELFFLCHIPDKGRVPIGEHELVIMGGMQFSPLCQVIYFLLDPVRCGAVKKVFPDKVAFVAPGEQLLPDGWWEAVVVCSGWNQVPGMACIEPGPGGLVREVLAGDGGYEWLLDLISPIGRPIVGEAPVMDQVV
jgi:hypothetical protein